MALAKIGIWALVVLASVQKAQMTTFESARLDIIVMIDDSKSISDDDFDHFMDVASQLPNDFPVRERETHVAMVSFADIGEERLGWSTTPEKFQNGIENLRKTRRRGNTATWKGLEKVRGLLDKDLRKQVPNVLLLFTDGCPLDMGDQTSEENYKTRMSETEASAAALRDQNVTIFLIYIGGKCEGTTLDPEEHQLNVVGGSRARLFHYNNFKELNVEIFKSLKNAMGIKSDCVYKPEPVCYFADEGTEKCEAEWEKMNPNEPCQEKIPQEKKCSKVEDCQKSCDEKFGDCNVICSSKSAAMCEGCKRCKSYKSSPASEAEPEPPATETEAPGKQRPGQETRESNSDNDKTWMIVGISLGVLAFLILVVGIVIVVVVTRRKRQRRQKQMIVLQQKLEEPPPFPSSHHSQSAARSHSLTKSRTHSRTRSVHPSTQQKDESRRPSTMPKTGPPTELVPFKTMHSKQPPAAYANMTSGTPKAPSSQKTRTARTARAPTVKRFQVSKRGAPIKSQPTTQTAAAITPRAVRLNLVQPSSRDTGAVAEGRMQQSKPGQVSAGRLDDGKNLNKTLPSWRPRKVSTSVGVVGKSSSKPIQVK